MARLTIIILAAAMLTLVLCLGRTSYGEPAPPNRGDAIKAGMILNFIRFTEWPDQAFDTKDSAIVVAVFGTADLEPELEATIDRQQVHGRALEVRRLAWPEIPAGDTPEARQTKMESFRATLRQAHVVFIGDSERDRIRDILHEVEELDILTISDAERFAEQGGMLGLTIRQDRIAFDANPEEIDATELKVSSQLLRLARTVETEKQ